MASLASKSTYHPAADHRIRVIHKCIRNRWEGCYRAAIWIWTSTAQAEVTSSWTGTTFNRHKFHVHRPILPQKMQRPYYESPQIERLGIVFCVLSDWIPYFVKPIFTGSLIPSSFFLFLSKKDL